MLLKYLFLISLHYLPASAHAVTCSADEYHVRSHFRNSYTRSDGTFIRATQVTAHCRKRSLGADYFLKMVRDGRPPHWPHNVEAVNRWSDADKEQVIEALEGLPEELLSNNITGIYRMRKSKDHEVPPIN